MKWCTTSVKQMTTSKLKSVRPLSIFLLALAFIVNINMVFSSSVSEHSIDIPSCNDINTPQFTPLQSPTPSFVHPTPINRSSLIDVTFNYPLPDDTVPPRLVLQILPTASSCSSFNFNTINTTNPITIPIQYRTKIVSESTGYSTYIYNNKQTSWGHIIDKYTKCAISSTILRIININDPTTIIYQQTYSDTASTNQTRLPASEWISYEQWSYTDTPINAYAYNDLDSTTIVPRFSDQMTIHIDQYNINYTLHYIFMGSSLFKTSLPALTTTISYSSTGNCGKTILRAPTRLEGYTDLYVFKLTLGEIISSCSGSTNTTMWSTEGIPHIRLSFVNANSNTYLLTIGRYIGKITIGNTTSDTSIISSIYNLNNKIIHDNLVSNLDNPTLPSSLSLPIVGNIYTTQYNIPENISTDIYTTLLSCKQIIEYGIYDANSQQQTQPQRIILRDDNHDDDDDNNIPIVTYNYDTQQRIVSNQPYSIPLSIQNSITHDLAQNPTHNQRIVIATESCYQRIETNSSTHSHYYQYLPSSASSFSSSSVFTTYATPIDFKPTNTMGGITVERNPTSLLSIIYNINTVTSDNNIYTGYIHYIVSYKVKNSSTIRTTTLDMGSIELSPWPSSPSSDISQGTPFVTQYDVLFNILQSNTNIPHGSTIERITNIITKVTIQKGGIDINETSLSTHDIDDICSIEWNYDCSGYISDNRCVEEHTSFSTSDNQCICLSRYTGDRCELYTACENIYNTLNQCYHNGYIVQDNDTEQCENKCTCYDGYTGDRCQRTIQCEAKYTQLSQCMLHGVVESVNGVCNQICTCDDGWVGEKCERPQQCENRYKILQECSYRGMINISSDGICDLSCTCFYPDEFTGSECERRAQCEEMYNSLSQCNHGGTVEINQDLAWECMTRCTCVNGSIEPDCFLPDVCANEMALLSQCHGRGHIQLDGSGICDAYCTCNKNWLGDDCRRPERCEDVYNQLEQCHGHGFVTSSVLAASGCSSECTCDDGWEGPTCSLTRKCSLSEQDLDECPTGQTKYSSIDPQTGYCTTICICTDTTHVDNCRNHGIVLGYRDGTCEDTCQCDKEYTGVNCIDHILCSDVIEATDYCNNHGTIHYNPTTQQCDDSCTCTDELLWTGMTCSQPVKCQDISTNILKCGQYGGIVQVSNDDGETCQQYCTCLYGYTGTFCTQCNITCYRGGIDNPRAFCQDIYPTIPPCLCNTNSLGRYCQYYNIDTEITIRNRSFPQWMIDGINSSQIQSMIMQHEQQHEQQDIIGKENEIPSDITENDQSSSSRQFNLFHASLISTFHTILGYDTLIDSTGYNTLTNINDTGLKHIYMNDKQIRVHIPVSNLRISNTKCYRNNNVDDIISIPSVLTLRISVRVGHSISSINKDANAVLAKWNELINNRAVITSINNIMSQYDIHGLDLYGCAPNDDDDYTINPNDPGLDDDDDTDDDDDDDTDQCNDDDSNIALYHTVNIYYYYSIIIISITMMFLIF